MRNIEGKLRFVAAGIAPSGETARRVEAIESPDDLGDDFMFRMFALGMLSSAAAWAPNPRNPPSYFDLPTEDGRVRPEVAARWAANSPIVLLDQHVPQLKSLTAIQLDVGEHDGLIEGNREFSAALDAYGIEHALETYEGDHVSGIPRRFEQEVLPFFSTHLDFE